MGYNHKSQYNDIVVELVLSYAQIAQGSRGEIQYNIS